MRACSAGSCRYQQALGRVGVPPVAGVDYMHVRRHVTRDQVRRAALRMPHHEQVRLHGRQVVDRIEQGLAFGSAGCGDVQVENVRAQPLGGDLEGRAGAGRILEEQVEHRAPRSKGTLLTSREPTLMKLSAVSRIRSMIARGRPSSDSR